MYIDLNTEHNIMYHIKKEFANHLIENVFICYFGIGNDLDLVG